MKSEDIPDSIVLGEVIPPIIPSLDELQDGLHDANEEEQCKNESLVNDSNLASSHGSKLKI